MGAVQLLGMDDEPNGIQHIMGTPLSESEIEALLMQTTRSSPLSNLEEQEYLRPAWTVRKEKPLCCGTRAKGCAR